MHDILYRRILTFPYRFNWIFRMTKYYQEDKHARSELERFGKELVVERKSILAQQKIKDDNNNSDTNEKRPVIFLDHLMFNPTSDGKILPKDEIKDNINTMISAVSYRD